MIVKKLSLEGFRNYSEAEIGFSDNVNVIIGNNAQGKTNLLEAVYYLATGRSFRARYDREAIAFDRNEAKINAEILADGREQKIEINLYRGKRKQIYINSVKKKTVSALAGRMTAVLFSPDDLYLIKEGALARRRLMDMCLVQIRPRYASFLSEYGKAYENKARILKDFHEKPDLLGMLEEYDDHMARLSAEIIRYRAWFCEKLSFYAEKIHGEFSGNTDSMTVRYKTVSTITDPKKPASELYELIMQHQREHRLFELSSGFCLTGAHKDDLEVMINGKPAKNYASQGQTRTAALSLKLAEREIHFAENGEYPLLLLDDVLSELDKTRQNFVLNRITGGQVLITCCEDENIAEKTGGTVIRINGGKIC